MGSDDPLVGESRSLAGQLEAAGVACKLHVAEGAPHSFLQLPWLPAYQPALYDLTEFLRVYTTA